MIVNDRQKLYSHNKVDLFTVVPVIVSCSSSNIPSRHAVMPSEFTMGTRSETSVGKIQAVGEAEQISLSVERVD